eukprot:COSAG05_NODE_300_length_11883_cov_12.913357_12_plen_106_part_00
MNVNVNVKANSFREEGWETKWGFQSPGKKGRAHARRNRRIFKELSRDLWEERPTRHRPALARSFAERERHYLQRKAQEQRAAEKEAARKDGSLYMPQFTTQLNAS